MDAVIGRREALARALGLAKGICGLSLTGGLLEALSGCTRAPVTGREQFILPNFTEERERELGIEAYRDVLRHYPLSTDPEINAMIRRVGERIADAANKPNFEWEFAVIKDDKIANAFALPGGKVAFFTGILKHTQTEAGVATVMGHEVTHALYRHGVERISRSYLEMIAQAGALAGAATGAVNPAVLQGVLMAYGVNATLPFNRSQESEADYIGLRLMAQAGYDPHEAVGFWERMSGCSREYIGKLCFRAGAGVPEFLSTHPSEETRIRNLEKWTPEAMKYYNPPPGPPPTATPPKAAG
jgi:predicted Zn-dependent protease